MFGFFKNLFGGGAEVKELVANGAVIIDVRTKGEFQQGHIRGAKNIPLQNIEGQLITIKKMNKPIVTCCMSGARSGQAASFLKRNGVEAHNGGGWSRLQSKLRSSK